MGWNEEKELLRGRVSWRYGSVLVWLCACVKVGDRDTICTDYVCIFMPVCLCLVWGPMDAPMGVLWLSVSVCTPVISMWAGGTCAHVCGTMCVCVFMRPHVGGPCDLQTW